MSFSEQLLSQSKDSEKEEGIVLKYRSGDIQYVLMKSKEWNYNPALLPVVGT